MTGRRSAPAGAAGGGIWWLFACYRAHSDSKLSSNSKANSENAVGDTEGADNEDCITSIPSLRAFKSADLSEASKNLRRENFRCDDFGSTFLGWFEKDTFYPSTEGVGIPLLIKTYYGVNPEWQTEVTKLARLAHPNIIGLLGYCVDEGECSLVYKHNKNNPSFARFLFRDAKDVSKPLSWGKRFMVLIGVARGLVYIHSSRDEAEHGDVNTFNIFLDEDFDAKLGVFGMETFGPEGGYPVTTTIQCTPPYLDPEYEMTCKWNLKCDIYSFGVVLLETLTGQQASKHSDESGMVGWARHYLENKSDLRKIMDPRLEQNYSLEHAFKCASLALKCVATKRMDRPSSKAVLRRLERIYAANGY